MDDKQQQKKLAQVESRIKEDQAAKNRELTARLQKFFNLDLIAAQVSDGHEDLSGFYAFSTGERVYIAMAANRADLLKQDGFTLAQAIARLGTDWTNEIVMRWQNRGPRSDPER